MGILNNKYAEISSINPEYVLEHFYNLVSGTIDPQRLELLTQEYGATEAVKFYIQYHPRLAELVVPTVKNLHYNVAPFEFKAHLSEEALSAFYYYLECIGNLRRSTLPEDLANAEIYRTAAHTNVASIVQELYGIPNLEVARAFVRSMLAIEGVETFEQAESGVKQRLDYLYTKQ